MKLGVSVVQVDARADTDALRAGDIVREVNRNRVRTMSDFAQVVDRLRSGDDVALLVQRGSLATYVGSEGRRPGDDHGPRVTSDGSATSHWMTCLWSAARPPRWASCIASSRARGCACRTASRSPPRPTPRSWTRTGFVTASPGLLHGIDGRDVAALAKAGTALRALVEAAVWPVELERAVEQAYTTLGGAHGREVAVAVRSSATAEDLPEASFAGQQETFLGRAGGRRARACCRRCCASLFTDRAIVYRA